MNIKKIGTLTILILTTIIVGQSLLQGIGRQPTNIEQHPILEKFKNNNWTAEEAQGYQINMYIEWTIFDTLEKLFQDADAIVLCEGVSKTYTSSVREGTFAPNIITHVKINVEKIYKGDSEKTIVVEQWGCGTYNGLTTVSTDISEIELNKPMILFLNKVEDNTYILTGGPQGIFAVLNGKVYSIGEIDTKVNHLTSQLEVSGIELSTFENRLTKLIQ